MKKKLILVLITIFISPIFAQEITQDQLIDKRYAIKLGIYKNMQNAKALVDLFPNEKIYISTRQHPINSYYYVFIANIKTKAQANKKLKSVRLKIHDAFIVLKRNNKQTNNSIMVKIPKITNKIPKDNNKTKRKVLIIDKNNTVIKDLNKIKKTGLSLKEAVLKSLNRSNKILSAKQKVVQAKQKLNEKKAAYKPRVLLYGTGGGVYHNVKDGLEQTYVEGSAELSLTQNLYTGGKVSNNVKKEKQNLKIAVYKFRSDVEKEILEIIESYINIVYEKRGIKATRDNMQDLQKILNIVTIKEQSGASSKGDLNYIRSNVENAMSALVKAESKYQNAISFYKYFIGNRDEKNRPNQENFAISVDDKNSTMQKVYKFNAKLQIAQAKIKMQKYDYRAKKSPFKPNLDFIMTTKKKSTRAENIPMEDKASAILSLNYNLYNGGKDKAILLKAKSKIAELYYKLTDLKESTTFNTHQMYENMISSQDSLKHTKKEVQANLKVTKSYWDSFKYGEQDIQALLLAQRALNRSQLDEIKEEKNFTLGSYKLLAQTGELLEFIGVSEFVNPDKIEMNDDMGFW